MVDCKFVQIWQDHGRDCGIGVTAAFVKIWPVLRFLWVDRAGAPTVMEMRYPAVSTRGIGASRPLGDSVKATATILGAVTYPS